MSRWRRMVGALLVGSVVLVGCGGSDGAKETAAPTTAPTTAAAGTSTGALTASDCIAATTSMAEAYGSIARAMANLQEGLENDLAAFQGYADKAPPGIRPDLRFVADVFADFVEARGDIHIAAVEAGVAPPPAAMAKLRAAVGRMASSEFTEAAARVSAWLDNECGR